MLFLCHFTLLNEQSTMPSEISYAHSHHSSTICSYRCSTRTESCALITVLCVVYYFITVYHIVFFDLQVSCVSKEYVVVVLILITIVCLQLFTHFLKLLGLENQKSNLNKR